MRYEKYEKWNLMRVLGHWTSNGTLQLDDIKFGSFFIWRERRRESDSWNHSQPATDVRVNFEANKREEQKKLTTNFSSVDFVRPFPSHRMSDFRTSLNYNIRSISGKWKKFLQAKEKSRARIVLKHFLYSLWYAYQLTCRCTLDCIAEAAMMAFQFSCPSDSLLLR